jgi:hypothetical protein
MTAQPDLSREHSFLDYVDDAHIQALEALDDDRAMDAVVWLSTHLAAGRRTLERVALRRRTHSGAVRTQRVVDRRLERLLRVTEQRFSGDALAAALDGDELEVALARAVVEHAHAEAAWLPALVSSMRVEDVDELERSYQAALSAAPTRPHPHAPHRGPLGVAAFRVDAWRDRVMDTMDSRHVPTPRPPRSSVVPGRWGRYLLGEMER